VIEEIRLDGAEGALNRKI